MRYVDPSIELEAGISVSEVTDILRTILKSQEFERKATIRQLNKFTPFQYSLAWYLDWSFERQESLSTCCCRPTLPETHITHITYISLKSEPSITHAKPSAPNC